jgi:hypothetical protein
MVADHKGVGDQGGVKESRGLWLLHPQLCTLVNDGFGSSRATKVSDSHGGTCSDSPKNTPAGIVEKLNKEINAGLADPKMKARLADLGATELALSHADFGKLIAADTQKWAKVVKFAGIKRE